MRSFRKIFSPELLALVFFSASLFFISNHVPWRDELQAWLITRESGSLIELIKNTRYEGHPILWYLFIFCVNRISDTVFSMQIMHVVIATLVVFIFAKFSPFSNLQKILFTFGYYPFYEYATISRNYGIGVLFIFTYCILYKNRFRHFPFIAITLFFLAQTSIFGLLIALVLFSTLATEIALERFKSLKNNNNFYTTFLSFGFIALGIVLGIYEILPPTDSGFAQEWLFTYNRERFATMLAALPNAFLPIPALTLNFWNAPIWSEIASTKIIFIFTLGVGLLFTKVFYKNKTALCIFWGTFFLFEIFFYTKFSGTWRHQGYLYIIFIAAIWVAKDAHLDNDLYLLSTDSKAWEKGFNIVLNVIFLTHVSGAIIAHANEYGRQFSSGRATAEYLIDHGLDKNPLVIFPDYVGPSILGYLNNSQAYYLQGSRYGTFVKWDTKRLEPKSEKEVFLHVQELSRQSGQSVILITNKKFEISASKGSSLELLIRFDGSIVSDENFYLYRAY